jgi:pyrroloquinoline quinone (PQQ) biosynthesis protein C
MNLRFERRGPLMELTSYPQWAQDMVAKCATARRAVVDHELWSRMCAGKLSPSERTRFMAGLWPVIEGFPGFMARSLVKTRYGRSAGDNLARRWLVRNIRVEQNHAEYWLRWAEGEGVPRSALVDDPAPHGTQMLTEWCLEASGNDTLAAGLAATNYAIEGATGEWARRIYEDREYAESFPTASRNQTLRWLQLHAAYDDEHPWEALEIICTLLGTEPSRIDVAHVTECIQRTYVCMKLFGDRCLHARVAEPQIALQSALAW